MVLAFLAPYVPDDDVSQDVPGCVLGDGARAINSCAFVLLAAGVGKVPWSAISYMVLGVVKSESLLAVAHFS